MPPHVRSVRVTLACGSSITVVSLATRLKLSNTANRHTPFTQWSEGVSSLSSTFTVIVIPVLQSAFLSCHFQQVPGATFPLATPSQKSWSFSEDPGISSMCGTHAPHYKTTNGFGRSGLWLNLCLAKKTRVQFGRSRSRAGRIQGGTAGVLKHEHVSSPL